MKYIAIICCSLFFSACLLKHKSFLDNIGKLSEPAKGKVGVAMEFIEGNELLSYDGYYHAPMQSVFKFPIALAVLNQVDKGAIIRDSKIHITKDDFSDTLTWSPMQDACHGRDTDLTVDDLLHFMVAQSDNIACDILLEKLGGTKVVMDYLKGLGITGINVVATEAEMHKDWNVQYSNWCEPVAMTKLLSCFYNYLCVSKSSTNYLMKIMDSTSTCPKRIKGLLPSGTIVARKSGTGGMKDGITSATNDIGIITLPNGKHLIISVFVSDSKANDTTRDAVIARITKAAYDEFLKD